jgi:uncharacterized protein YbaR (Trm112 family)
VTHAFEEYCACPICGGALRQDDALQCRDCGRRYEIRGGIPILLPAYDGDVRRRYLENYETISEQDLDEPFEPRRHVRHNRLVRFVGATHGAKVLDVGSSNALYLRKLDAGFKVAFDIAYPYLAAADARAADARICGDAEFLPFRPGFFDVVIVSDVLEHVLNVEDVVRRLRAIATPATRLFVEVPWEEDLSSYQEMEYEFTHLRRFDDESFSRLFADFDVVRTAKSFPNLDQPLTMQLAERLPTPAGRALRSVYDRRPAIAGRDYRLRRQLLDRLPRYEAVALLVARPMFRLFELRPSPAGGAARE